MILVKFNLLTPIADLGTHDSRASDDDVAERRSFPLRGLDLEELERHGSERSQQKGMDPARFNASEAWDVAKHGKAIAVRKDHKNPLPRFLETSLERFASRQARAPAVEFCPTIAAQMDETETVEAEPQIQSENARYFVVPSVFKSAGD